MASKDLFNLTDQVALVVGGSGGMGAAFCTGLAEAGAKLMVGSTSSEKADEVMSKLAAAGHEARRYVCDVTNREQVFSVVDDIANRYGRIDILVNCAGISKRLPAESASEEEWVKVLDVNLIGAFRLSQAVGRHMIRQKRGKIVHISSTRGMVGPRVGASAYCASKGGMNMLTRQLAVEWAHHGINVNAIAPTWIDTPFIATPMKDEAMHKAVVDRIPMGRLGQPSDLVGAALFLASPASDFVTGHVLYVDGGIMAAEFYAY